jgi:hypothetical protein
MDNVERNNESRHELYTKLLGGLVIQEPKGWANDIPSFKRDKESRGILSKTEIDLEFYGDGAEWISLAANSFGIQETVLLIKSEKDIYSLNEEWRVRYVQEVDMGTYKKDKKTGKVTVKATEGGLYDRIKKRKSKKYDLINTESADGDDIGSITTYPFQPQPRGLFLESFLEDEQNGYRINSRTFSSAAWSETTRTIPLKLVYNSDADNIYTPWNGDQGQNELDYHDQNYNIGTEQSIGDQIVWRMNRVKLLKIKIDLTFVINDVKYRRATDKEMMVELRRSKVVGDSDKLVSRDTLLYIDAHHTHEGQEYSVNTVLTDVEFEIGDSLSIVFATRAILGAGPGSGYMDTYLDVSESSVIIEDETPFPITVSRCITPFDLFERIIAKITGKNGLFKSSIFGEGGEYEHVVVDNGFWARGFPDVLTDSGGEERKIQFNTSFKDAFDSFNYLEPLCWFTEISGRQEVVRIEKATYTMKNFIGVRIPSVDKIEEKSSKKDFFSSIKIGHKKNLDYEEIFGLEEPNGMSEFGTHISKGDSVYAIESEYRPDSVGYELIRRKPFTEFPKEDTPRDKDIFMHDARRVNGIYYHNLWNTTNPFTGNPYFDSAPTGIFEPDTVWNLRLSPMNRLFYGHGYSIKRGLYHFPQKSVRFDSSNSNQNLRTTLDGVTLHEGGTVLVGDLEKPRIEPMIIMATFFMTQAIEDQIIGTTNVDGEEVPNFFGLFEYTENGNVKYGRLVKLDAKDESKLTLINVRL